MPSGAVKLFPVASFERTTISQMFLASLPAMQETWFDSWVGKIPWRRKWQSTPVFLPGKFHGQRILVGCSPWGHRIRHNWLTNSTAFEKCLMLGSDDQCYYYKRSSSDGKPYQNTWADFINCSETSGVFFLCAKDSHQRNPGTYADQHQTHPCVPICSF